MAKMNVKLLRKVAKHILAEPKRFAMDWWYGRATPGKRVPRFDDAVAPACGTVACIAGWSVILSGVRPQINTVNRRAAEFLQIDDIQAGSLFFVAEWPDKYKYRYSHASPGGRARIAVQRIEHFIKTGK